jgi:site-specific DNA-cytosine methylase
LSSGKERPFQDRIYKTDTITPAITTSFRPLYLIKGEEMEIDTIGLLDMPGQEQTRFETEYRIRRLTPLECWRLMGFSDTDFRKAEKVCSNTQLYKQAGNSIVVDVLEAIFKNLIE